MVDIAMADKVPIHFLANVAQLQLARVSVREVVTLREARLSEGPALSNGLLICL
jgi:hypothetical protein